MDVNIDENVPHVLLCRPRMLLTSDVQDRIKELALASKRQIRSA